MESRIAGALATETEVNPGTGTEKESETETDIGPPAHDMNVATASAARGVKDIAAKEVSAVMMNVSAATVTDVAIVSTRTVANVESASGAIEIAVTVTVGIEIATMRDMKGTVAIETAAVRDVQDETIVIATADMEGDQAGAEAPLVRCHP
jgi:hypothetical protein